MGQDGAAHVRLAHVSVGCNRVTHVAAWGPSGLVAFGAHNAVAVYDPAAARILRTLPGHRDRVNCVEWLPRQRAERVGEGAPEDDLLASGAADGGLILWSCRGGSSGACSEWRRQADLPNAHGGAVTCIAAHLVPAASRGSGGLLATCSSDATRVCTAW